MYGQTLYMYLRTKCSVIIIIGVYTCTCNIPLLLSLANPSPPLNYQQNSIEYEHEKFDRLQASLLNDDPATTAFYNAQLRTEKRVCVCTHCLYSCISPSIHVLETGWTTQFDSKKMVN